MSNKRRFTRLAATVAGIALLSTVLSAQAREYSVSTVLSDAFPWGQAAEKWAELVKERSGGAYHSAGLPEFAAGIR